MIQIIPAPCAQYSRVEEIQEQKEKQRRKWARK
jgi:hypothetical protein